MAFDPITSWQIEVEKVEVVADFVVLGSRITVDGDCSHENRRRSLLERKVVTNLDSVLKSRDFTVPTNVCIVKAMVLFFFFLIFSLTPALSLSSFILIKRLFSSSLLSAIRVASSAYLRLLIFLLPILIWLVSHPVQHFSCGQHIG